jgi:cytochrome P450
LVAGNETTATLIANAMHRLVDDPELAALIEGDHSQIPAMLEEALRVDAPVQMLPRMTKVEVAVGGTLIPAGEVVWVAYASANHDEDVFSDPAAFEVDRENVRPHLAFGKGAHYCIGAALARSEARIAFERLLSRATNWAYQGDPDAAVERALSMTLRGLSALRLTFDRRP